MQIISRGIFTKMSEIKLNLSPLSELMLRYEIKGFSLYFCLKVAKFSKEPSRFSFVTSDNWGSVESANEFNHQYNLLIIFCFKIDVPSSVRWRPSV